MKKSFASVAVLGLLAACGEPSLQPGNDDLPFPRGFSPSVKENQLRGENGEILTPEQARARLDQLTQTDGQRTRRLDDEFNISASESGGTWPVDTITYKRFRNTSERAIYLRRTLGRYALIEARERGLGTQLSSVRAAASSASSSTSAEWWSNNVHRGDLAGGESNRAVSLPDMIKSTVRNSNQIAAFGDLPAIRGTAIQEARGRFVPEFYAEASRQKENETATSPAIAPGSNRAIDRTDEVEFGVRSRLLTGGEISVSQRFTTTDTNRITYIPGEQSRSLTTISLVQPLLRGSGVTYNDAPRRIANLDTGIATEEFRRQSESHLMEVERAYWNLYVARAVFVQRRHLAGHGQRLSQQVSGRANIDADPVLVTRAQSLAQQWAADTVRAQAAMDNAEFRLAALVNDPRLGPSGVEVIPSSAPNGALSSLRANDTIEDIFVNRPELQQAILQYEAALLREGIAANESLPELDLVLEVSTEGGANGSNYSDAFSNRDGGSGNLMGLKFSVPLGFDERDARYKRRRIETIQQERQVLNVVSTILLEVDVSANEYIVATNDLVAQRRALGAAQSSLNAVQDRWDEGIGGESGIALLSVLLSSYQQVQVSEQAVATARATREIAAANLARARGVLLARWGLKTDIRKDIRNQPTYKLENR